MYLACPPPSNDFLVKSLLVSNNEIMVLPGADREAKGLGGHQYGLSYINIQYWHVRTMRNKTGRPNEKAPKFLLGGTFSKNVLIKDF